MAERAADDDVDELRDQDRYLPIANISRIVKSRLPYNAKVAKEAKETMQVRSFAHFWHSAVAAQDTFDGEGSSRGTCEPTVGIGNSFHTPAWTNSNV